MRSPRGFAKARTHSQGTTEYLQAAERRCIETQQEPAIEKQRLLRMWSSPRGVQVLCARSCTENALLTEQRSGT
ncbi:unnamed protein product [Arctogadus glacialis]